MLCCCILQNNFFAPFMTLHVCFKTFRLVFLSMRQKSPTEGKMCNSKKTFGTLVLLCCVFLTECRVLKFVVAVSCLPFVSMRLIHRAVIWATSHQWHFCALLLITLGFSAHWALLHLHIYATKDYFEPPTPPAISLTDTLFINLFAHLSVTLFQQWTYSKMRFEDFRLKQQMLTFVKRSVSIQVT